MANVTKTISATQLEIAMLSGTTFEPMEHSTLNEFYGVGEDLEVTGYPKMGWLTIGIGADQSTTGASGRMLPGVAEHDPSDAGLYDAVPFYGCPEEDEGDMTALQRAKYGMRKVQELDNGERWVFFYLLKITPEFTAAVTEIISRENGVNKTTPYTSTVTRLKPSKLSPTALAANIANDKRIAVSTTFDISLDEDTTAEIISAITALKGDAREAVITEMGVVTGQELPTTATDADGLTITYNEVAAAQISHFIQVYEVLSISTTAVDETYKIGNLYNYTR